MKKSTKIAFFDSDCKVCNFMGNSIAEGKPLRAADLSELNVIDKEMYCNEIAVFDPTIHEVRYGINGISWLLEDKIGKLAKMMTWSIIKQTLEIPYKIFAYNRRMLFPVTRGQNKICDPSFNWSYRILFIVAAIVLAVVVSYISGEVLRGNEIIPEMTGVGKILAAGVGWLITGLIAQFYRIERKMDYYGHLATIMSVGILLQVPFDILYYLFDFDQNEWFLLVLLCSDIVMTLMHYARMKKEGWSQWYTVVWWAVLHVSAGLVVAIL